MLDNIDIFSCLNCIPHAIVLLDQQLKVNFMNSYLEILSGYDTPEAKGVAVDHIIRASIGTGDFQAAVKSREPLSREGNIINADRKKIPVRITASPLNDDKDQFTGMLVVLEDISLLSELDKTKYHYDLREGIIGHSPGMQEVFELLPVLAATDATVLITGETGTGKDVLAESIHRSSKRAQHPFIKVNCGAIPTHLLESELFGHKRGAFTGAHSDKPGMFQLARRGTIFLTEIGDLPLQLQVKLLTVLDDKEFFPLGSSRKTDVNVRIITATNRNLQELVDEGKFREDFFFRLNVLRAHLPPLRERDGDIRLLLDYFLRKIRGSDKKYIKGFTKSAYSRLESYKYPGNVRELRNIVEYAVSLCQKNLIDLNYLPVNILASSTRGTPAKSVPAGKHENSGKEIPGDSGSSPPVSDVYGSETSWTEIERKKIIDALLETNGNRTKTAELLGWGRSTLWRKIKRYGIE